MKTPRPPRFSAAQGRRFGMTVGGAFLALAGVAWWRDHQWLATIFGSLAGALLVAALTIPAHLGPVERAWMALAHRISRVTTPIVMAVIYFIVLTPVGVLRRRVANPLVHAKTADGYWKLRPPGARRSASMERQF